MKIDYIVVQAGGKGTRLEHLTRNKPKALVPINNLPMLFYLFKKYPEKNFIIIGDYKKDVLEKYLSAFAKVKYLVVGTEGNNGTCSGISQAMKIIPEKEAFMLIWSDLILPDSFQLPEETNNWIGISKGFTCRWKYESNRFEEEKSDEYGVAGLFVFSDKSELEHVPQSGEFVRWLQEEKKVFDELPLFKTKEYGLIKDISEPQSGRCRPFNKLTVKDNVIIKEGIDEQGKSLAVREKRWYKFCQEAGFDMIPKIYEFEPFTMERIDGKNVFEYELSADEKKMVINKIIGGLSMLHNIKEEQANYFSIWKAYYQKTIERIQKVRDLIPFANNREIVINGRKCRNVFYYQDELADKVRNIQCNKFCLLHGDCTFSNILLRKNLEPVFIDPRGYFGYSELVGDPLYDWAKLYYSICGNYDQFNLKRFNLIIENERVELLIASNGWEDMKDEFISYFNKVEVENIKLVHAIIWLSLTTYAWEDYDSICGAFYQGLYYLEEVL